MQTETGYRVEVVTVRKLEFETDSFAFGDKILARWYPDKSDADKKGILIVVTTAKDGAIIGGPSFMQVGVASCLAFCHSLCLGRLLADLHAYTYMLCSNQRKGACL